MGKKWFEKIVIRGMRRGPLHFFIRSRLNLVQDDIAYLEKFSDDNNNDLIKEIVKDLNNTIKYVEKFKK